MTAIRDEACSVSLGTADEGSGGVTEKKGACRVEFGVFSALKKEMSGFIPKIPGGTVQMILRPEPSYVTGLGAFCFELNKPIYGRRK